VNQAETSPMELSRSETSGDDAIVRSAGLDPQAVRAVVVVPTFRRPAMLADTLASLAGQRGAPSIAVVVVENDAAGREGLAVARRWLAGGALPGIAFVETAQGNVHAINAGFAMALASFPSAEHILMMDDDEVASPGWVAQLVDAAEREDADVVGGPVVPCFRDEAPAVLARHPVFWPSHDRTGPVPMIYGTGNCLMRRRVFERLGHRPLDLRFNFLGGGDMDFFTRCRRAGLRSFWVQEALITETVPAERARVAWVLRRGMRIGSINRAVDLKHATGAAGRAKIVAKDVAIVPLAILRAALALARTRNLVVAAHPLAVSVGRIAAWAGVEQQPYRAGNVS
jgi:glycosyltransferase involved in cell wall biosynthesis